MKIGDYINEKRAELNITREKLAEITGKSVTFLYNIENEKTKVIKDLNMIFDALEELSAQNKKSTVTVHESHLMLPLDVLKGRGLDLSTHKFLKIDTVSNYYHKYEASIARYIEEYDQAFCLRTILSNLNMNEIILRHNIAIDFTYRLVQMIEEYINKAAKEQNIAAGDVKFNRILIHQWDEILCKELDAFIEEEFGQWRPKGNMSKREKKKIADFMKPREE